MIGDGASGDVVGIQLFNDFMRLVLENKERESFVEVCGRHEISIGDYVFVRDDYAYWTSAVTGRFEQDEQLNLHRVGLNGEYNCEH